MRPRDEPAAPGGEGAAGMRGRVGPPGRQQPGRGRGNTRAAGRPAAGHGQPRQVGYCCHNIVFFIRIRYVDVDFDPEKLKSPQKISFEGQTFILSTYMLILHCLYWYIGPTEQLLGWVLRM
jgi:hypothetical protein